VKDGCKWGRKEETRKEGRRYKWAENSKRGKEKFHLDSGIGVKTSWFEGGRE